MFGERVDNFNFICVRSPALTPLELGLEVTWTIPLCSDPHPHSASLTAQTCWLDSGAGSCSICVHRPECNL